MLQEQPRNNRENLNVKSANNYAAPVLSDYYLLPKFFSEASPADLALIINGAIEQAEALSSPIAARAFHEVAGSAAVELGLTIGPVGKDVDDRIEIITIARHHLRLAADARYLELEHGLYDPDMQANWRRAELQYDFAARHVYSDLIAGEVTQDTKDETLAMLRRHYNYAKLMTTTSYKQEAVGLKNELVVLTDWWENLRPNDAEVNVAIPSTARGGSGLQRPKETHDIAIATLSKNIAGDNELQWQFHEVKSKMALAEGHLGRYVSGLVVVGRDENIRHVGSLTAK